MTINDRYKIDIKSSKDIIGRGGQSIVYQGDDITFKSKVAIKVYEMPLSSTTEHLISEFEQVESYSHPNIIGYLDWGVFSFKKKIHFSVIMNYANSGSLADYQARLSKDNLSNIHNIFGGILEGLKYIHARGIYHRDLKPSNILLTKDPKTQKINSVITDFLFNSIFTSSLARVATAKYTTTFGTIEYMAPELLGTQNAFIGPMTDIWSFGILLYEFFKGELPFGSRPELTYQEIVGNIFSKKLDFSNIPKPYDTIIELCLDKDVTTRINDANVLLDVIKKHKLHFGEETDKIAEFHKAQETKMLSRKQHQTGMLPVPVVADSNYFQGTIMLKSDISGLASINSIEMTTANHSLMVNQMSKLMLDEFQKIKEKEETIEKNKDEEQKQKTKKQINKISKDAITELMEQDEMDNCFEQLATIKKQFDHEIFKGFVLIRGEWSRIRKQEIYGLMQFSEMSTEKNKIKYRLFDFIQLIDFELIE